MKVLYLNHTSQMSGGERSLLTLLSALPCDVAPVLTCPAGALYDAAGAIGIPTQLLRGTAGSLKLHPVHTARAVSEIGAAAVALRRLANKVGADLIHANSIRAGLIGVLSRRLGAPPVVVHVHDALPAGALPDLVLRVLARGADEILVNSRYTGDRLALATERSGRVVHNPVDPSRFHPAIMDRSTAKKRLGMSPNAVTLGLVGQITPWKGHDDALRTLALLRRGGADVNLLFVGSPKFTDRATRYDNMAFERTVMDLAQALGVSENLIPLGERSDVPEVMRAIDLLLVPSWHEPFGMVITEAMATEVPVVATEVGGPPEILQDGEQGLLLPPREPRRWAEAIRPLVESEERRRVMGAKGRQRVLELFTVDRYLTQVLAGYDTIIEPGAVSQRTRPVSEPAPARAARP